MTKRKKKTPFSGYRYYAVLFLICILFLAVPSAVRLVRFYVFDPQINEAFTADAGDERETDLIGNFFLKQGFLNANGFVRRLLFQREMNGVVRLKNDYLTDLNPELDAAVLAGEADAVAHVQSVLKEYDIPFGDDVCQPEYGPLSVGAVRARRRDDGSAGRNPAGRHGLL